MNLEQAYHRLAKAGILDEKRGHWRTTEKWERLFMKAHEFVVENGQATGDLRLPMTYALLDAFGPGVPEDDLRAMVEVLVPLELREEEAMEVDWQAEAEEPVDAGARRR